MKNIFKYINKITLLGFITALQLAQPSLAELDTPTGNGLPAAANVGGVWGNVNSIIQNAYNAGTIVASVIFLVLFFVGGIYYLINANNEPGMKKARSIMIDAVIGIVCVLSAWTIAYFIGHYFNPNF